MPNSKFAKFSGRLALVLALFLGGLGMFGSFQYAKFQQRVAALKASGELIEIGDLAHGVDDPQDDAVTYLLPIVEAAADVASQIRRDEIGFEITDEAAIAQFEKLNLQYPELYKNLSLAADAPDMSLEFDERFNFEIGILELQNAGLALSWKGKVLLGQGDIDGAVQVSIELLQLAEKIEEPVLLNAMLARAYRLLAHRILYEAAGQAVLDPDLVEQATRLLEKEELNSNDVFISAVQTKRSQTLYYLINPHFLAEARPESVSWLSKAFAAAPAIISGNRYLDHMETILERSREPLTVQYSEKGETQTWLPSIPGIGSESEISYFLRLRNGFGAGVADCRAIRIVLALNQTEGAGAERTDWPLKYLAEIGVPQETATDPFTDRPMTIKRINGQWHVYSFGPDQQDGDGKRDSDDAGLVDHSSVR